MAIHMPKYPNMCISLLRYQSFDQWPSTEEIDKEAFVDAGFFYTGFNDHVRCFDCGIGLRNWQNEDNPDAEHARWSPKCKFIIDRKGIDFVESIQKAVKQEEVKAILDQSKVVFSFSANELSNIGSITEGDIDIMSCGRVPTKAEKKNPLLTDAAQAVLSLGYLPKLVSSAVTSILQENGWRALNAENILLGIRSLIANEKLTENGAKGKSTENGVQPVTFERKVAKTEHKTKSRDSYQRMIKENNEMREQLTCKICCEDSVSVAFLPCGHLSCCWLCAPSLKLCPLCRAEVKGSFKVHI